ncbi:MAG: ABC transporter permease [Candidatus Methanofastidiosia archaeon]|jgi:putative ABC transport system permease protein
MAIGTVDTMVSIIDHSKADIWVLNEGNEDLIQQLSIIEDVSSEISEIEGVKKVYKLIYSQNMMGKEGQKQAVMIVGITQGMGSWNLISGDINDLKGNTVIVDESVRIKLGEISTGDTVTINKELHTVVGISKNAKSFIYPFVFTSHETALQVFQLDEALTHYILVEVYNGYGKNEVAQKISEIEGITAVVHDTLRKNTADYMLFESGMGLGTVTFAVVGLLVAVVVITLTIYTATMEKIPEFGTLKAIGASKKDIDKILIEQVLWSVSVGYVCGLLLSVSGMYVVQRLTVMPIKITVLLAVAAYGLTLTLSLLGSVMSIRKVHKIDPAIVFRG